MERISLHTLPLWIDSSFRYFEKHERHLSRYFYTTNVLVVVFEGVLRFSENGVPVEVHTGEYYVQKHGHQQDGAWESDSPKYYWIHFQEADFSTGTDGLPLRGRADLTTLIPLFRELDMLRITGAPIVKLSAVFYKILSVLHENAEVQSRSNVVSSVIAAVTEDIRRPFSLEDIAKRSGYSKNHIINIFKKETGKTPYAFLNDMKVDMAKKLLLHSDSSLASISIESGFGDYINLYRCFLKTVGISPTEWRKKHRILQKTN